MEAAKQSGLSEGEDFTMANFTYANSAVVSRMFEHLKNTMFLGITVSDQTMHVPNHPETSNIFGITSTVLLKLKQKTTQLDESAES